MLHPFVASIKKYNPEAFASLLADAKKSYPKLNLEIKKSYHPVNQDEELITQALARAFRSDAKKVGRGKNNIIKLLTNFVDKVIEFFESVFGEGNVIKIPSRTRFDEILERKEISALDLANVIKINDLAQIVNSELRLVGAELENEVKFNNSADPEQDTLDLIALMQYQYTIEGLS